MNTENLTIFIINLSDHIERKEHMQRLCDVFGLRPVFIEAVDGRLLSNESIEGVYDKRKSIDYSGRELSLGEIGCGLSHQQIYQRIVDENIELALILEDDVDFNEYLLSTLNETMRFPVDWELVLFGHHGGFSREATTRGSVWYQLFLNKSYKLMRPAELVNGTYGYLINLQSARKLLSMTAPLFMPIDHYTGSDRLLNIYIIKPAIVMINENLSDNYHSMGSREGLLSGDDMMQGSLNFSCYKKMAVYLNIYKFLTYVLHKLKWPIQVLKPLKAYKIRR